MKSTLILILAASSCVFAQEGGNANHYQTAGPGGAIAWGGVVGNTPGSQVQGAPYSATITNESIQILADGNQVVQTGTGSTARDSQGRTRQDVPLPTVGNLPADAPHLVFIQDPVTHTFYTLNLMDKTAQKMSLRVPPVSDSAVESGSTSFFVQTGNGASAGGAVAVTTIEAKADFAVSEQSQVNMEDLGSQTMQGLVVNGVRTIRTIPAGQIGNSNPMKIVTEVWTSPDLKTVVYSKRSDPRMGEDIFQLTNIARTEPDPSLFAVPADFKIIDGPEAVTYHSNQ
jgi:hypothetical protein